MILSIWTYVRELLNTTFVCVYNMALLLCIEYKLMLRAAHFQTGHHYIVANSIFYTSWPNYLVCHLQLWFTERRFDCWLNLGMTSMESLEGRTVVVVVFPLLVTCNMILFKCYPYIHVNLGCIHYGIILFYCCIV